MGMSIVLDTNAMLYFLAGRLAEPLPQADFYVLETSWPIVGPTSLVCNGKNLNDTLDISKNNIERKPLEKNTPNVGFAFNTVAMRRMA